MLDWNWFYSTIAQCSAAIVGFMGAFVIVKIINKETKYYEIKHEIKEIFSSP